MKTIQNPIQPNNRRVVIFGLCSIAIILALLGIWSVYGLDHIIHDTTQATASKNLKAELTHHRIEHLKWAGRLHQLMLNENTSRWDLETDPKKCDFEKWLYGQGRKEVEKSMPSLESTLVKLKASHDLLHKSATKIKQTIHKEQEQRIFSDKELTEQLKALTLSHEKIISLTGDSEALSSDTSPNLIDPLKKSLSSLHAWHLNITKAIIAWDEKLAITKSSKRCDFCRFLNSGQTKEYMAQHPILKSCLDKAKKPHRRLHAATIEVKKALKESNIEKAKFIYHEKAGLLFAKNVRQLHKAIAAELQTSAGKDVTENEIKTIRQGDTHIQQQNIQAALQTLNNIITADPPDRKKSTEIFISQTQPALKTMEGLLEKIILTAEKKYPSNKQLPALAYRSRNIIILFYGIIGTIIIYLLFSFRSAGQRSKEGDEKVPGRPEPANEEILTDRQQKLLNHALKDLEMAISSAQESQQQLSLLDKKKERENKPHAGPK